MKKGYSKNRHFSKGTYSLKQKKSKDNNRKKYRTTQNTIVIFLVIKSIWTNIDIAVHLIEFLIDKVPILFKWLLYLFGVG